MNWNEMKQIDTTGELKRLERAAFDAGKHQADWWSVLLAVNESLSKVVGRGAQHERLQSAYAYEVCRAGLFAAWSKGSKQGEPVDVQATFLDTSQQYT